jgi:DNA-directed RNA polymerase III subunit RPC6
MASSSAAGRPALANPAKLEVLKDVLFDACQAAGPADEYFTQDDLLALDVIPRNDLATLIGVIQALTDAKLFIASKLQDSRLVWQWRDREEAAKYKLCGSIEEEMVYGVVDEAGAEGIWSRHIQDRLSINQTLFNAAIKHLLSKRLIVPFKSVEHPNRKMFIKASIQPSERAAGGVWHNADGELDEAFIEEIQRVIFDIIKKKSTYHGTHPSGVAINDEQDGGDAGRTRQPTKGVITGGAPQVRKRNADEMSDETTAPSSSGPNQPISTKPTTATTTTTTTTTARRESLLSLPAGYKKYPTVRDIARLLSATGITTNSVLSEADVQALVDVLVYDGLVEPVTVAGRKGYRLTRIPRQSLERWSAGRPDPNNPSAPVKERGMPEPYVTALAEAPCGRCPVFELCEEGGPVAPSNCVYFQQWLGLD